MNDLSFQLEVFYAKIVKILSANDIVVDRPAVRFSALAVSAIAADGWNQCAKEMAQKLASWLDGRLTDAHRFVAEPWVREISIENAPFLKIAIINSQSEEWYGQPNSIGSFDFIYERSQGYFDGCTRFLDLGGHQMVWASYYASLPNSPYVVSYEPSVLNAVIGAFNCLINGVIERVKIVPFAVSAVIQPAVSAEGSKMLVDFMTTELRAEHLSVSGETGFDFVKVDIEGYEYEMLSDDWFSRTIKQAKRTHLELHLGHLIRRGVSTEDVASKMRVCGFTGSEIYSKKEVYSFLADCDPHGYFAFCIDGKASR